MKILFFLILISTASFAAPTNVGKIVGQVGLVEGDVLLDSKPVKKNAQVREGSVIEVKKGHATVILGKGSVFNIAEDSKMVVTQYALKPGVEEGELDLKFGRTRALILNQGNDKKDIRIKSRAATMGVRGTEIYVSSPKDPAKPIQFFTLEGKAEVRAYAGATAVPVNQNQGVSASGVAPPTAKSDNNASGGSNSKLTASGGGGAVSSAQVQGSTQAVAPTGVAPATITVADVKNDIAKAGLDPAPASAGVPAVTAPNRAAPTGVADGTTLPPIPPPPLDPVLDRASALSIRPHFCNANTGTCN